MSVYIKIDVVVSKAMHKVTHPLTISDIHKSQINSAIKKLI